MRPSRLPADPPTLETRLAQLDAQLGELEATLRAHHQTHSRTSALQHELATLIEEAKAVLRGLASTREAATHAAETATRDALARSAGQMQEFEARARHILDAYGSALRAAQHAVARAEARIEAFDERVARDLAEAGREVRQAAALLRERTSGDIPASPVTPGKRSPVPAALAVALLLGAMAASLWAAWSLRDASARAAAAERQATESRLDAQQRIASLERAAKQASADAAARAARTERMVHVALAPDARRTVLSGLRRSPNARGLAVWSLARGVSITGTGLPALDPGSVYQVWLVTPGAITSLGVADVDAAGRLTGVFDLPVTSEAAVRGFMLTREPAGGSSRPSRSVVLAS